MKRTAMKLHKPTPTPCRDACYSCGNAISRGRGGKRADGHNWHTRCWNKAFEQWIMGPR